MKHNLIVCGCGAIGSRVVQEICNHPSASQIILIDDDVVEANNVPTSSFTSRHIGRAKATALSEIVYFKSDKNAIQSSSTLRISIDQWIKSIKLGLTNCLILDCFDNPRSRNLTASQEHCALHIGVSANRTGSVIWNSEWQEMDVDFERGENPICTRDIGLPIILKTTAEAVAVLFEFFETGDKVSRIVSERGVL